jgi:hypothetical protein
MGLIEADFTACLLPLFGPPALRLCCSNPTSSIFVFRLLAVAFGTASDGWLRFGLADFEVSGWVPEVDFGVSGLVAGDEDGLLLKRYGFWAAAIPTKATTITKRTTPLRFIILNLRFGTFVPQVNPFIRSWFRSRSRARMICNKLQKLAAQEGRANLRKRAPDERIVCSLWLE